MRTGFFTGMGLRIAAASIGLISADLARAEPKPPPTPAEPKNKRKPTLRRASIRPTGRPRPPLDKGEGAAARRLRQIQRGQLRAENGLVLA